MAVPPGVDAHGRGVTVPAGDGDVELLEVQPEGKGRMSARDWANGARWRGAADDPLGG